MKISRAKSYWSITGTHGLRKLILMMKGIQLARLLLSQPQDPARARQAGESVALMKSKLLKHLLLFQSETRTSPHHPRILSLQRLRLEVRVYLPISLSKAAPPPVLPKLSQTLGPIILPTSPPRLDRSRCLPSLALPR